MTAFCVGVDWGTSSLRAWLLSRDGEVLAESSGNDGILSVGTGGYPSVLAKHLNVLGAPEGLPVIICGMAGARQGWYEASYLNVPGPLHDVALNAVSVPGQSRDIRILPGMAQRTSDRPDVMRGEETQLLGLCRDDALVCIPGTHSKWVSVRNRRVEGFSTFMTGELFALLSAHSILRHALTVSDPQAEDGFHAGVSIALRQGSDLGRTLFSVRARGLVADDPGNGRAYLSGLLIGSELASARMAYGQETPVLLMADGELRPLYSKALAMSGFVVEMADLGGASRAGLLMAGLEIWGEMV